MALDFAPSTTDRVEIGSDASIDDLPATEFSILAWIYRDANGNLFSVWGETGGSGTRVLVRNDQSPTGEGQLEFRVDRATTATSYVAAAGSVPLNAWTFIACTYDDSLSTEMDIYTGSLTAAATEVSYIATTNGSGSYVSDAANNKQWGQIGTSALAFAGRMGWGAMYDTRLTPDKIIQEQFNPKPSATKVSEHHFGYDGTGTQIDYSGNGNNGTVTGATVADHPPLVAPFGADEYQDFFTAVAGGGFFARKYYDQFLGAA